MSLFAQYPPESIGFALHHVRVQTETFCTSKANGVPMPLRSRNAIYCVTHASNKLTVLCYYLRSRSKVANLNKLVGMCYYYYVRSKSPSNKPSNKQTKCLACRAKDRRVT